MKYKVGDLVVLIANRLNPKDPLSKEYTGRYQHLKGQILKIECEHDEYNGWDYTLEVPKKSALLVKSDQIILARIYKTEIYKALTEGNNE